MPPQPAAPVFPSLDDVERAIRVVHGIRERLLVLRTRARAAAAHADWHAPSARAFHDRAARWSDRIGEAEACAADAADALLRVRAHVQTATWPGWP